MKIIRLFLIESSIVPPLQLTPQDLLDRGFNIKNFSRNDIKDIGEKVNTDGLEVVIKTEGNGEVRIMGFLSSFFL